MRTLTIALIALALAACGSPTASPTPSPTASATIDGEVDSLDEARLAWANAGIASYDFTISRECFCLVEYIGPFKVQVRDGITGYDVTFTRVIEQPGRPTRRQRYTVGYPMLPVRYLVGTTPPTTTTTKPRTSTTTTPTTKPSGPTTTKPPTPTTVAGG